MNNQEVWKDVIGYEGLYQVSSLGRVKSLGRKKGAGSGNKFRPVILMKTNATSKDGYIRVSLCLKGISKSHKIHKLVAINFLGHVPCGMDIVVDHIDCNKQNNQVSNLQLISNRENATKDRHKNKNKISKYVGVGLDKRRNKWRAYISIEGKQTSIGYFKTETEANLAYLNKRNELCALGKL